MKKLSIPVYTAIGDQHKMVNYSLEHLVLWKLGHSKFCTTCHLMVTTWNVRKGGPTGSINPFPNFTLKSEKIHSDE